LEVFLGRVVVSLSDELEEDVRKEVERVYWNRPGAMSIFFETLIRTYLNGGTGADGTE